jgi:putative polyketide hydroxylase
VTTHRIAPTGPVADPTGQFSAAFGLSPTGATLIRPDGIVAWRGTDPNQLRNVISALLAR